MLVTLANILNRHGHEVTVVTTVKPGPLSAKLDKNISLVNINRKSKWNIFSMYKLYRAIRRYDIIHVHSSYNLRYLFLTSKLFFLRKPIFFHEHFGDIEIDATVKWHHRYIYPKTTMICVSRKIYDWASVNLQMGKDRLFVLPNIVLKNDGVPEGKKSNDGKVKLLIVSNIRPTKNLEFAIELLYRLKQSHDCNLTIIGQRIDEVYYQTLISLINKYALADNIAMLHAVQDIQPLLHNYDLAIHTAKSESGPLALIEYLAQCLPFLTYNTGETVFQIKDDLPECVIGSFEIEEWINRIETLLAGPKEIIKERLSSVYANNFSAESYYQQCLHIYEAGIAAKQ